MSYSINDVKQWCQEAGNSLNEAKQLCHTADISINTLITNFLVKLPQDLELIESDFKFFEGLNDLLSNYIKFLDDKIYGSIDKYNEEHRQLMKLLDEFHELLAQLEEIKVPSYLLKDSLEDHLLKNFISMDEIFLLFENIDRSHDNMGKLDKFLDKSFQSTVITPFESVISKKNQQFNKTYDELVVIQSMNQEQIQKILKENESLEQELVSLLQMLTNHYDQCVIGVELYGNEDVNYDVLLQDAEESKNVLKDLKSIYEIIINNEIRGKKVLIKFESLMEKAFGLSADLKKMYTKFKSTNLFQIIIFMNKYHEMDINLLSYIHIINQLIYYYKNFLLIFKTKYLLEYHHQQYTYPKQFLEKLNKFLNEELATFQQQERERRHSWLDKYGEFIPHQFKLPGDQQPAVVQVITEGLEEDVMKEKEVLELIKRMKNNA